MTVWTEDRVETLEKLWREGLSGSRIAERIGVSRCAVLGKVNRLGLPNRAPTKTSRQLKTRRLAALPIKPTRIYDKTVKLPSLPIASPILKPLVIEMREPKTFAEGIAHEDLTPSVCQWPLNSSAPWRFCGGEKIEGKSYCLRHCNIAFSGTYKLGTRPPRPEPITQFEKEEAA